MWGEGRLIGGPVGVASATHNKLRQVSHRRSKNYECLLRRGAHVTALDYYTLSVVDETVVFAASHMFYQTKNNLKKMRN